MDVLTSTRAMSTSHTASALDSSAGQNLCSIRNEALLCHWCHCGLLDCRLRLLESACLMTCVVCRQTDLWVWHVEVTAGPCASNG